MNNNGNGVPIPVRGDVAIIGVSCTYPGARNALQFWQNIINKVSAIADVTPDRWDPEIFYDPDPAKPDRIYCKKGGYMPGVFYFNPLKFGVPPNSINGAEPDHFLVLRAVYEALDDAGYIGKPLNGDRVSVLMGKGNYMGPGLTWLMHRSVVSEMVLTIVRRLRPDLTEEQVLRVKDAIRSQLPKLGPENAGGLIPNISTGRVANRFDFMGRNFTVDGACASSLLATEIGVQNLLTGKDDMVLVGGVHLFAHIPFLSVFDAMRAMSISSVIRPFDENADGTMSGEGVGVLVLKRLADAERDGDRIYAVIKGVGSASDGRAKGITAPRVEGEEAALRRAYESSGVAPETVGLIEGHGTGTPVGDTTELEALRRVFGPSDNGPTCAIGSVKSMIGHAMPAAGAAGMIKAALSLYHKVLPPTLNVVKPHPILREPHSRFYVNTETRPWIHPVTGEPRRAGVNAFGFGGINAHVVMEEYRKADESQQTTHLRDWDCEVVVIEGQDRKDLMAALDRLRGYAAQVQGVALRDVAYTLNTALTDAPERVAIVASSLEELVQKIDRVKQRLSDPNCKQIRERAGLYYFTDAEVKKGKVAWMFPGEGSQYLNMLADLCIHFPVVRECFDVADSAVKDPKRVPPSAVVFPPPAFSEEEEAAAEARLWSIERATETVLTADGAIYRLLQKLGIKVDMMTGHSAGEWIAMAASGILDVDEFVNSLDRLAEMYERLAENSEIPRMAMLAVGAGRERVQELVSQIKREVHIANDNCPHQVVVVVEPQYADEVSSHLLKSGVFVEKLPYDRGYHTPAFTYICDPLREFFSSLRIEAPKVDLYSCTTADLYPKDKAQILDIVANTFARPLLYRQTIEKMYEAGARIFIEVGPRGNLTAFVDDILRGKPHLSIPIDQFRRPGLTSLNHAVGMMAACHLAVNFDVLYSRRAPRKLSLDVKADSVLPEEKQPGVVPVSICYAVLVPPPADLLEPPPQARPQVEKPAERPVEVKQARSTSVQTPEPKPAPMPPAVQTAPAVSAASVLAQPSAPPPPVAVAPLAPAVTATTPVMQYAAPAADYYAGPSYAMAPPASVIEDHFSLMEEFLQTQEELMMRMIGPGVMPSPVPAPAGYGPPSEAYAGIPAAPVVSAPVASPPVPPAAPGFASAGPAASIQVPPPVPSPSAATQVAAPQTAPAGGHERRSLIRERVVVEETPGKSMTIRCTVDLDEHRYLEDHCLYFEASERGKQGNRILWMPMTGSIEMLAEAASLLQPGLLVTGVKNVQALRPVTVEKGIAPATVVISLRRLDDKQVRASMRSHRADGKPGDLLTEAVVVFDSKFPEPPLVEPLTLVNRRPAICSGSDIYTTHRMFHGPSFQGIVGVDGVGENGLVARLKILPTQNLLKSDPDPKFHIDPYLLDAAGQLVGYWPIEYLSEGFVLLPIRLNELVRFGENPPPGTELTCQMVVRSISHRQLRADFDVIKRDGTLWLRITGWEDWRFHWEQRFYDFWRFPNVYPNGRHIDFPELDQLGMECRMLDPMAEVEKTGLSETVWTRMILERNELASYLTLPDDENRLSWLFSRAIAKDAVRMWVKRCYNRQLYPADVELAEAEGGKLRVAGFWVPEVGKAPFVAACYRELVAVAVAGASEATIGMARVVPGTPLSESGLQPNEQAGVQATGAPDEWIARAVAAKQAAARWLQPEMGEGEAAAFLTVTDIDVKSGRLLVVDQRTSGDRTLVVRTVRDGDWIIAVVLE